jgi:hypothetical protein
MGYRTGSKQPSGVNDLLRPWTNRFLPSKRLAQAMNNWHASNIQAGGWAAASQIAFSKAT